MRITHIALFVVVAAAGAARADSLSFPSALTTGCLTVNATVTLTTAAPPGGRTFNVTSSPQLAPPATVTVNAGATTATFPVATSHVAANTVTTLTLTEGATTLNRNLTLRANAPVSMSVPSTLGPGQSANGAFTLACVAPAGGNVVTVTSSSSNLTVQTPVTVAEGQSVGAFTLQAGNFTAPETVTVTATRGGVSRAGTVRLKEPGIRAFTFSTTIPVGGQPTTGIVTLDVPAGAAGLTVNVSSSNPAIAQPTVSSVVIPQGATEGTFGVTTVVVDDQVEVVFTATTASGLSTRNATLTVRRNRIENVRASQLSVSVCRPLDGEVKLLAGAGAGGSTVNLTTDRPDLVTLAPTTLSYAAGEQRAQFTATTASAPPTPETAVIDADFNGLVRPLSVQVIRTSPVGCP